MPNPAADRVALAVSGIYADIEQLLVSELGTSPDFQDVPTEAGRLFGIVDYQGWGSSSSDEFSQVEQTTANIWIVFSVASRKDWQREAIRLTANLRSLLPQLKTRIDTRKTLINIDYPSSIQATKRAPIKAPNSHSAHLWIGDMSIPITLQIAISKSKTGAYL